MVARKPFSPLIAAIAVVFLTLAVIGQSSDGPIRNAANAQTATAAQPQPQNSQQTATDGTQFAAFRNLAEGLGWIALVFGCIGGVVVGVYSAFNRTALKEWKERAEVRQQRADDLEKEKIKVELELTQKKLRISQIKEELGEVKEESKLIHDISLRRKALLDQNGITDVSIVPNRG